MIRKGDFPNQIALTSRRSGFIDAEIYQWIKSRKRVT
jgi:predicted DNA-binding transcriptional regulator AlpA